MDTPVADFDTPWKEALEEYLTDFLALCFPDIHAGIDWMRPPVFRDAELRQALREGEIGTRLADKLVQVWLLDGSEAWVLIHIEVQSQDEGGFAKRMFTYYYRILDHFDHEVVSLAVLADERSRWRPDRYTTGRWGCSLDFQYPVVKLRDWRPKISELEESDNPFATVILSHLVAQDTKGDVPGRERAKMGLVRRLYERGYSRDRILSLFRFIDWLLALPAEREVALRREIMTWEEERRMSYITSIERIGRAEGLEEGLERGREEGIERGREEERRELLRRVVTQRFGTIPPNLEDRIVAAKPEELTALFDQAVRASAVDEI